MAGKAKYENPETLESAINAYFDSLISKDKDGAIIHSSPPTVNGLAYALGFTSRQSLLDYEANPAFSCLIKSARLRTKTFWEERLADKSPAGAIFWLKNHDDWHDVQELTGKNGGPIAFSDLSDEDLDRRMRALLEEK